MRTSESRSPAAGIARALLIVLGCACVALGAVGAVVPGMPTTVFLLVAAWAFAKSSPALAARLERSRLAAPMLRFRRTGAMTRRGKTIVLLSMWIGIVVATAAWAHAGLAIPAILAAAGVAGSYVILARVRTLGSAA